MIFSFAVVGENLRYCYVLGVIVVIVKPVRFCHSSAITEHIYLKLKF